MATLQARDLERRVMELKTRGVSTMEIGRKLGITVNKASAVVAKTMAKTKMLPEYEKEVARQLELTRLDEIYNTLYPRAVGDEVRMVNFDGMEVAVKDVDYQALKYVLEISRDRRKILDLDIPATKAADPNAHQGKIEVNVTYTNDGIKSAASAGVTVIDVTPVYEPTPCLPSPQQED